ncbi:MAG TPA: hypothetical protein VFF16_10780, partial [Telluria sp.]|nr:hypothetical protein [Telluria sp.]
MKRVAWALMSALFFGLCGPALADPYIYFIAHPPKLDAGQNLLLDVNVAGLLPDVMGGFQITLEYDPRLILLTGGLAGAGIGTALGDVSQGQAVVGAVPPTPDGRFTFFEVSLLEGRASTCVF